jgi:hypothetical protein
LGDNRCRVEGVTFWAGIDFVWNKDCESHTFNLTADSLIFLFECTPPTNRFGLLQLPLDLNVNLCVRVRRTKLLIVVLFKTKSEFSLVLLSIHAEN